MRQCAIFAANRGYALTNSRQGLIRKLLESDWRVVLATADDDESNHLERLGAEVRHVEIERGGVAIGRDMRTYRQLAKICAHYKPALLHNFHSKPVIMGSLAARRALGIRVRIVNTITGLGHAFIKGGAASRLAGWGYRVAIPRSDLTIFQNRDDRQLFLERKWVTPGQSRLITGSGVDLERFPLVDRTNRNGRCPPVVVMLGRLIRQKGIGEFVHVAKQIRRSWPTARFLLAGEEDPVHPDAITVEWLAQQEGRVEYLGRITDVRPLLAEADLLLFPSYREGTPRVVLEAAATGLPTVGFDVPGVREAVRHDDTGFLVRFQDVESLTNRVRLLLEHGALRWKMGFAARKMVEEHFDMQSVQRQYLEVYRELGMEL